MNDFVAVYAHGSGFELGASHARATSHLRDDVAQWVTRAVRGNPLSSPVVSRRVRDVEAVLDKHSPETMAQIAGMATVYDLPASHLLVAVLGTYLASASSAPPVPLPDQGCSTFALTSRDGSSLEPILVKNRDNDCSYLHMQTLLHVQPALGHPWTALSTAGAPDVHSSGMNAEGLSVVDTHVPSSDVGPGLPRFSLMRRVLEECASTAEALELLQALPMLGLGNLVLADRFGEVAVVECGHSALGVIRPERDYVVATNHYVSQACSGSNLNSPTSAAGRNSRARHAWLTRALDEGDPIGVRADPVKLLSHHGTGGTGGVCVHDDEGSPTISTVVFRPNRRGFEIAQGTPCEAAFSPVPAG